MVRATSGSPNLEASLVAGSTVSTGSDGATSWSSNTSASGPPGEGFDFKSPSPPLRPGGAASGQGSTPHQVESGLARPLRAGSGAQPETNQPPTRPIRAPMAPAGGDVSSADDFGQASGAMESVDLHSEPDSDRAALLSRPSRKGAAAMPGISDNSNGNGNGNDNGNDSDSDPDQDPDHTSCWATEGGRGGLPSDSADGSSHDPPPSFYRVAFVTSIATVCRIADGVISVAVMGRVSENALSGSALGQTVLTMLFAMFSGFSVSLNPLVSQAVGMRRKDIGGQWLNISMLAVAVGSVLLAALLCAAIPVVRAVAPNHEIADNARSYMLASCLTIYPMFCYQALRQYLQAQGITSPELSISVIGLGASAFLHWLFVLQFSWGSAGSAFASAVTFAVELACIVAYIRRRRHSLAWVPWSWSVFTAARMKEFAKVAAPISLLVMTDEWLFSGLVFVAALLGDTPVAAMSILVRLWDIAWSLWWGVGMATQVRVGYFVGAEDAANARASVLQGMRWSLGVVTTVSVAVLLVGRPVARLFVNDHVVVDAVLAVFPWFAAEHVLSCAVMFIVAVVMGAGQPGAVSTVSAAGMWLASVPAVLLLGFAAHQGLLGIWRGLMIGEVIKIVATLVVVRKFTWARAMEESKERANDKLSLAEIVPDGHGHEGGGQALLSADDRGPARDVEMAPLSRRRDPQPAPQSPLHAATHGAKSGRDSDGYMTLPVV